jgi:EAL domain-containing protein (putative c-di-GMP-specific phosphodiesterase class I)
VAVNVSARQFAQHDFVEQVSRVLAETGIRPDTVKLEITESVSMMDTEYTVEVLTQLQRLGVCVSIDDFGTGYSSLAYLHSFPMDTLKIDRSFVAQLDRGEQGRQIVGTIMNLARDLKIRVIAEGAETSEHVEELKTLGCDFAQGYYFSRPVEPAVISGLLAADPEAARSAQGLLDREAGGPAGPEVHVGRVDAQPLERPRALERAVAQA